MKDKSTIPDKFKLLIINEYKNGLSSRDLEDKYGFSYGSIKNLLKKRGVLRNRSEAASLSFKNGKKVGVINNLILMNKTSNRYLSNKSNFGNKNGSWLKDRTKVRKWSLSSKRKFFIKTILEERNYTCELTDKTNVDLCVHHICPIWSHPELKYGPKNVIVVQKIIHKHFHQFFGSKTTVEAWNLYTKDKYYERFV